MVLKCFNIYIYIVFRYFLGNILERCNKLKFLITSRNSIRMNETGYLRIYIISDLYI